MVLKEHSCLNLEVGDIIKVVGRKFSSQSVIHVLILPGKSSVLGLVRQSFNLFKCCLYVYIIIIIITGREDVQVVNLPIIDSLSPRPPYLPLAVPEDLAPRLIRLHGDPIVWWVGQILKYLLKPQPKTAQMIQDAIASMGFQRPIVG